MTRKRFVKLCMATGMQRNLANIHADSARRSGSYQEKWEDPFWQFSVAVSSFGRTTKKAAKIARRFSKAFAAALANEFPMLGWRYT